MHPWLWEVAVLLNREGCYLQFLTAKINLKWRCRLVYGKCYFLLRCQPKDTKVQYTHSIISHSTSNKSDAEQVVPINQETAETLNTYCAYNMLELFRNIIFKKKKSQIKICKISILRNISKASLLWWLFPIWVTFLLVIPDRNQISLCWKDHQCHHHFKSLIRKSQLPVPPLKHTCSCLLEDAIFNLLHHQFTSVVWALFIHTGRQGEPITNPFSWDLDWRWYSEDCDKHFIL